jgi:hypothetical protein
MNALSQETLSQKEGQSSSRKRTFKQAGLGSYFSQTSAENPLQQTASKRIKSDHSQPSATPAATIPTSTQIGNESSTRVDLKELLNFNVPFATRSAASSTFQRIANCLLNKTVLALRRAGDKEGALVYFRICEVEFYLNDYCNHKDTFTHGDPMQKQTAKWYFHRFGSAYKAGTYKGLDLAIGKGDSAAGGILIRSLMPARERPDLPGTFTNSESKADFIEGPCNSVNKILEVTKPEGHSGPFEITHLVS